MNTNLTPQFGALASARQAATAQSISKRLFGDETARNATPRLTFFKNVSGLGDWGNTVDEVGRDGETLEQNLHALNNEGAFLGKKNVDVLYLWNFPNKALAVLGQATVKLFRLRQAEPSAHEVKREGSSVLMRSRYNTADLISELDKQG